MKMFQTRNFCKSSYSLAVLLLCWSSSNASAFFVTGKGHYGLLAERQTAPGMSSEMGQHNAIDQSLRILGELRSSDRASFFLEFGLFEDQSSTYLGDTANLVGGASNLPSDNKGKYPNTLQPSYQTLRPHVSKFYMRYALDYFLIEAGRRGRNWGLGLLLDDGSNPFARAQSTFDGVSLDLNIQKQQVIGAKIGYDKISENGAYVSSTGSANLGPTNNSSDINQFFFSIMFDDTKINAASDFSKQIGIYAAFITSGDISSGGSNTNVQLVDLYTSFFFKQFVFRNELLLRLGKTADPNMKALGGRVSDDDNNPITNSIQSMGFCGNLEWILSQSGGFWGKESFAQGDATKHSLMFSYAYAPGDENGYYGSAKDSTGASAKDTEESLRAESTANAIAFHPNFHPTLIMFHGKKYLSKDQNVDGVFDATKFMNATMFALSHQYMDLQLGNFVTKLTYAFMNTSSVPEALETYYNTNPDVKRSMGYYGKVLGYELDFTYSRNLTSDLLVGGQLGYLFAGPAYKSYRDKEERNNFYLGAFATFQM